MNDDGGCILLKAVSNCYLAFVDAVSYEMPEIGCPDYYKERLWNADKYPSIYFRLTSIFKMDIPMLNKFNVASSGRDLVDAMNKSMNSIFYVEAKVDFEV